SGPDFRYSPRVADVVLRQGLRIFPDYAVERPAGDPEGFGVFRLDCLRTLFFVERSAVVAQASSGEAGDDRFACGGATGKQGGIPERADCFQLLAPRDHEAE